MFVSVERPIFLVIKLLEVRLITLKIVSTDLIVLYISHGTLLGDDRIKLKLFFCRNDFQLDLRLNRRQADQDVHELVAVDVVPEPDELRRSVGVDTFQRLRQDDVHDAAVILLQRGLERDDRRQERQELERDVLLLRSPETVSAVLQRLKRNRHFPDLDPMLPNHLQTPEKDS